jgi:hypothetical protein
MLRLLRVDASSISERDGEKGVGIKEEVCDGQTITEPK